MQSPVEILVVILLSTLVISHVSLVSRRDHSNSHALCVICLPGSGDSPPPMLTSPACARCHTHCAPTPLDLLALRSTQYSTPHCIVPCNIEVTWLARAACTSWSHAVFGTPGLAWECSFRCIGSSLGRLCALENRDKTRAVSCRLSSDRPTARKYHHPACNTVNNTSHQYTAT